MAELTRNFTMAWQDIGREGMRLAHKVEQVMEEPATGRTEALLGHYRERLAANDAARCQALQQIRTTTDRRVREMAPEDAASRVGETASTGTRASVDSP